MFGFLKALDPTAWLSIIGAASLAGGIGYGAGYWLGRHDANANCRAAAIQSQLDAARADLTISKAAETRARIEAKAAQDAAATNQSVIEEFRNAPAPASPSDDCRLSPADADRLRRIK